MNTSSAFAVSLLGGLFFWGCSTTPGVDVKDANFWDAGSSDKALGERVSHDGALGDGALGDGALGDGALGDGASRDGTKDDVATDAAIADAGYGDGQRADLLSIDSGPPKPLRIVIIGDSITQGSAGHQSYRYALWKKLIGAGMAVDFVGSLTTNHGGTPSFPDYLGQHFDRDHEGHWGWRADQILSQLPGWLATYDADVALVHIGSNDAFQGQSTASTVAEIEGIIDALRADNPAIAIFLAKLIPSGSAKNVEISKISSQIEGIALRKHQASSPITVVDQSLGFNWTSDTYDGTHPNLGGEVKMAMTWFDALVSFPRPRVVVSTDIGGNDPDDFQSLVHLLVYADRFDIEGLISSPPYAGRASAIHEVLNAYDKDRPKLALHAAFPTTGALRAVTKQGATAIAPSVGFGKATDGSAWIIARAKVADPRPLYVLVWGSITDVAQALHDDPSIEKKLRVYSIGSWNTKQDPAARQYLYDHHPGLWWIENDSTFRGMFVGGDQSGDLGNSSFVTAHVAGKGALGTLFAAKKADIKMGDTPSVLYLLYGNAAQPKNEHWGGRFLRITHGANYWHDHIAPAAAEGSYQGARTVNFWRKTFLRDWQTRMLWCVK